MTRAEAEAWRDWTLGSATQWQIDPVHCRRSDFLAHVGGESGAFVSIRQDGPDDFELAIGWYEGAVPHVGEALFRLGGRRRFSAATDALAFLVDRVGLPWFGGVLEQLR